MGRMNVTGGREREVAAIEEGERKSGMEEKP